MQSRYILEFEVVGNIGKKFIIWGSRCGQ